MSNLNLEAELATLAVGIVSFATTNIDDLVLLIILFSNRSLSLFQVVASQFLGIISIILLSLGGALVSSLVLPSTWLRFLGIAPILLGIKKLLESKRKGSGPAQPKLKKGSETIALSITVLANGGDNISVYTPIFATVSKHSQVILIFIYLGMTAIWIYAAYLLSKTPQIRKQIKGREDKIFPLVLIIIGIFILLGR